MAVNKKFIRAKEVVEMYGIPESTLWYYVRNGKLKRKKISERVTLFSVADLDNFFGIEKSA